MRFPFRFTWRAPRTLLSIDEMHAAAKRVLPEMALSYIDSGADDLASVRANRDSFSRWSFLPRVLTGARGQKTSVRLPGAELDFPVYISPTGLSGLAHWTGEPAAAHAAERMGTISMLSTAASWSPEEFAQRCDDRHFFQLYPQGTQTPEGRQASLDLMERAARSGFSGLVVTVDVPTYGNRERERRAGVGNPPVFTPRRILDAALRPAWVWALLRHGRISSRLFVDRGGMAAAMRSLTAQYQLLQPFVWDDVRWMREHWVGPLYVKGVLRPDDAVMAKDAGADAIIVSNHGGRQLDGAVASLDALPAIIAAVGADFPVLLDGGVRRGTDVVKALCLGAKAVGVGRPCLYALAANGSSGVEQMLGILRDEVVRTLTLLGVESVDELTPDLLTRTESTTAASDR